MVVGVQMILKAGQITTRSCYVLRILRDRNLKPHSAWENVRLLATSTCNTNAAQNLERKYTDKHEWITLDGKIGTVGITHYAQDALGDVVYAQLPDVGTSVTQNDECGALESVKAASELYCPISGNVTEKNASVEDTPALINQSCYEKGWLFKVEVTKPEELTSLMNEADYDKFLKSDPH